MVIENLVSKIRSHSEVVVYGAGKMGQQLVALLRNLPEIKEASLFLASTGAGTVVEGIPVLDPVGFKFPDSCLVLVASGRGNHRDISEKLAGKIHHDQVVFLYAHDMDALKKMAFTTMLLRLGIDTSLLKSCTNDLFAALTMFDGETYNGNIRRKMFEVALEEAAHFVIDYMPEARAFHDCWDYRQWVLEKALAHGLFLEFGVADGSTLDFFACSQPDTRFFGFDSFIGLPEFWKEGFDQGRFAQPRLPCVPANAELIQGWFAATLPAFFERPDIAKSRISFIHVDCDLYSSTRDVLAGCAPFLQVGTILAFDEYFNYPGWQAHEHKAMVEFASELSIGYRFIAYVENGNQVAIEITSIGRELT